MKDMRLYMSHMQLVESDVRSLKDLPKECGETLLANATCSITFEPQEDGEEDSALKKEDA
jgi:hypothetical protein